MLHSAPYLIYLTLSKHKYRSIIQWIFFLCQKNELNVRWKYSTFSIITNFKLLKFYIQNDAVGGFASYMPVSTAFGRTKRKLYEWIHLQYTSRIRSKCYGISDVFTVVRANQTVAYFIEFDIDRWWTLLYFQCFEFAWHLHWWVSRSYTNYDHPNSTT